MASTDTSRTGVQMARLGLVGMQASGTCRIGCSWAVSRVTAHVADLDCGSRRASAVRISHANPALSQKYYGLFTHQPVPPLEPTPARCAPGAHRPRPCRPSPATMSPQSPNRLYPRRGASNSAGASIASNSNPADCAHSSMPSSGHVIAAGEYSLCSLRARAVCSLPVKTSQDQV